MCEWWVYINIIMLGYCWLCRLEVLLTLLQLIHLWYLLLWYVIRHKCMLFFCSRKSLYLIDASSRTCKILEDDRVHGKSWELMEFIAHVFHICEYLLIFFSLAVRIGCKSHKVKCESLCGWSVWFCQKGCTGPTRNNGIRFDQLIIYRSSNIVSSSKSVKIICALFS